VRVLVVEDEPTSRMLVVQAVTELGHECESADDGEAGWG